ncbi:MAG: thioesterase family protein [Candidatus Omnitrophica bacterium]|nr:thioesterase family protein [Candidatus Omnitrophota bacterium]MDD5488809.1 thioesterase family protein [Candidatus Omnitrophota bacterium]
MNAVDLTEIRVRYAETDQMGVVYYSNYFVWFEVARTEYFRSRGVDYRSLEEKEKIYLPVVEAYCRYRMPIRYDDRVIVETQVAEVTGTRLVFEYKVKREGKTCTSGRTVHVFVNAAGEPIPIPKMVKNILSE